METLAGIESFVRSAEVGSFSAAARRLGLTPAAVSKNVAKLEAELDVRLFQRSTRSLTLTESGERFLREVGGGLATIKSAVAGLANADGQPAGTLRVSMSTAFGRDYILPLLGAFVARYPAVLPDWHFENRQVDLVAEGFDAAVGGGIELSPGLVARELARAHVIVVASPSYLAGRRPPRRPSDLPEHAGILRRSPATGRIRSFTLTSRAGAQTAVELQPRAILSDPEAICHAALQGVGIGLVPVAHVLPYLKSGALVRLLPDWYADAGPISIYFQKSKLLPKKTRVFVDFVVAHFRRCKLAERLSAT
jgi:DNA-binding transcriptional LysR family regulator